MVIPEALLQSLQAVPGFNRDAFLQVHEAQEPPTSVRINQHKCRKEALPFAETMPVPWCKTGLYLAERPSFIIQPWWHAGAFYVQEASSMALEQVFNQHVVLTGNQSYKVLDLCASPGGKSTHLLSMLRENDVLISNEVIGSRANILLENITRWGAANCMVTNNDPADFKKLEGMFDLIVIDAPCSGSGLFRRDPEAIKEWSEDAVMHCSQRQERIITDAWPALAEDGVLVYTTCSYSPTEDEAIVDWIQDTFSCEALSLSLPQDWGIVENHSPKHNHPCYRFFPYLVKGEGFFMAIFRKKGNSNTPMVFRNNKKLLKQDIPVNSLLEDWLKASDNLQFYRHKDTLYAMPADTYELFLLLQNNLRIRKAGICLGDWMHNGLQPDHALAMSGLLHDSIPYIDLNLQDACQYLRKEQVTIADAPKGWMLARFQGIPLGWMKHLGNRTNNYYPKEWRLRKQ